MYLRDSICLAASPEAVWEVIADPTLMSLWNSKCVSCEAMDGTRGLGSCYHAIFHRNRQDSEITIEIIEFQPEEYICLRHTGKVFQDGCVTEEYRLCPTGSGTKLVQRINLSESRISWIIQLVAWFIHAFGYRTDASPLARISQLVESSRADSEELFHP